MYYKKPDFLCIGPEKTGTTWLYSTLKQHPDVYLPPVKELLYFNEGNFVPHHSVSKLLFSRHWHYRNMRRTLGRGLILGQDLPWRLRYAFGTRSDEWYRSLFRKGETRVSGDITPLYYHLSEEDVHRIATGWPDVKVIAFVRDPIERAWSKARMNLIKHRRVSSDAVSNTEFADALHAMKRSWRPYDETERLWKRHQLRIHFASFDDLRTNPRKTYQEICEFLGIRALGGNEDFAMVVNRGVDKTIPASLLPLLLSHYGEEIGTMAAEGNASAILWAQKYGLSFSEPGKLSPMQPIE
jgi:hypothetical protein